MYANIDQRTQDLLFKHMEITPETPVLIFYDDQCNLAIALHESYKKHLTNFQEINFPETSEEASKAAVDALSENSLVILIQTGSFRMSKFRWRLELFHRHLAVLEHARLGHNLPEEGQAYIDALTCDIEDNTKHAEMIEHILNISKELTFTSKDGSVFTVHGPFEEVKKNLGTYETTNRGGGFPVGEVFSEPKNLQAFNGTLSVRAYPGVDHRTKVTEPFTVTVKDGLLIDADAPESFQEVLDVLKTENDEGTIQLREIGFGLNKHMSFAKPVSEPTAFERQRGLHFSLGMKHNIYRKKVPKTVNQRFHIDIFVDIDTMAADGKVFFENGEYVKV